jgi:hypothetical protein
MTGASYVGARLQRGPKIGIRAMMTPTTLISTLKFSPP